MLIHAVALHRYCAIEFEENFSTSCYPTARRMVQVTNSSKNIKTRVSCIYVIY